MEEEKQKFKELQEKIDTARGEEHKKRIEEVFNTETLEKAMEGKEKISSEKEHIEKEKTSMDEELKELERIKEKKKQEIEVENQRKIEKQNEILKLKKILEEQKKKRKQLEAQIELDKKDMSPWRLRGKGRRGYWVKKREDQVKGRTKSNEEVGSIV